MKITIINSVDFWSMGWATDPASQQDVIRSLRRAGVEVEIVEVGHKAELVEVLQQLKSEPCLVWPNAYQVYAFEGSSDTVWLADVIDEQGLPMIGSNARALKNVMLKDECQRVLEHHGVAIPAFASLDKTQLNDLETILETRHLSFPLFVKPNALSSSKGITQDCVVHNLEELHQQALLMGDSFGYPVMVEEYLPGRDITVAVFMTPERPVILATYYDTEIYDDPGAVLDHSVRMRDWDDGKWLRVVEEPEMLAQIESVVLPACDAVGISEFTRIDCRLDRNGRLKAFDVNGLPGLELPFSTTVWQMIVKMKDQSDVYAFDTLVSLVVYCAACRHQVDIPSRIKTLAEDYIAANTLITERLETA
ncbi:D-alanine--D-alanine ligase family protein [Spongorhabdus nitratireducens]